MLNQKLKIISTVLEINYTNEDIITEFKKFYPYEWKYVQEFCECYRIKEKKLNNHNKTRYKIYTAETLLYKSNMYKKLSSKGFKEEYNKRNSEEIIKVREKLYENRKPKIQRISKKIEKAKIKTQQMTPEYIDQLIGLYERKNTTQKDKVYIITELKKYYNNQVINFFFKLNDTELNRQLREIAFKHLQSFNFQPRLRKQKYMKVYSNNRKRREYLKFEYPYEKYLIPGNPNELDYRIENALEQKFVNYDFFISHSSVDSKQIQELIKYINKQGKNIYCDWINDIDYLKRHLFCEATLKVINARLDQSKAIIFVNSTSSKNSIWCKYELNYFLELQRPMYEINIEHIESNSFIINEITDFSFKDKNYLDLAIEEGKKIVNKNRASE